MRRMEREVARGGGGGGERGWGCSGFGGNSAACDVDDEAAPIWLRGPRARREEAACVNSSGQRCCRCCMTHPASTPAPRCTWRNGQRHSLRQVPVPAIPTPGSLWLPPLSPAVRPKLACHRCPQSACYQVRTVSSLALVHQSAPCQVCLSMLRLASDGHVLASVFPRPRCTITALVCLETLRHLIREGPWRVSLLSSLYISTF